MTSSFFQLRFCFSKDLLYFEKKKKMFSIFFFLGGGGSKPDTPPLAFFFCEGGGWRRPSSYAPFLSKAENIWKSVFFCSLPNRKKKMPQKVDSFFHFSKFSLVTLLWQKNIFSVTKKWLRSFLKKGRFFWLKKQ